jgi:DNA-binding transcriptional ArsR family regulator
MAILMTPAPPSAAALDLTFAALADPTRRAILRRLMDGEASVTELVRPFELSQPTISRHLDVLERAGLVERRRDAQFRRCRLNAARLQEAWHWIGGYHRFWEESFDRLDVLAKTMAAQEKRKSKDKHGRNKT